ncbi:hypothetical protein D3C75_1148850 [compost metagenome]
MWNLGTAHATLQDRLRCLQHLLIITHSVPVAHNLILLTRLAITHIVTFQVYELGIARASFIQFTKIHIDTEAIVPVRTITISKGLETTSEVLEKLHNFIT